MKFLTGVATFGLIAASFAAAPMAGAGTRLYATEPAALAACQADEVVWVDLDRGRFYHKDHANYGKSNNGGYACMKAAHAQYREGH